ncbi:MAG TPA: hypothetical protein PLI09_24590 [Candidatus Hydrogenedentes bacterium]|nr:hypothetical protein [Candidatus Hydrogenedentota bacterium]
MSARLQHLCLVLVMFAAALSADGTPSTYAERKAAYLADLPADASGDYGAVARMAVGRPIDIETVRSSLEAVENRSDCADFRVAGLLRLMYLFGASPQMPDDVRARIQETLTRFKYWIDEPGTDNMCYWSENHQILFHSDEYLAGNLYEKEVFTNAGINAAQHRDKGKRLVEQWLDWRERFGFSEWLSNDYYAMDIMALTNLIDFAPDAAVARRAAMAVDQLALNMALNSFQGNFTCTHGRTYEENVQSAAGDNVKQAMYLLGGIREYTQNVKRPNGAGISLATSRYTLPPPIEAISRDTQATFENHQCFGIAPEEYDRYGFAADDTAMGMFFWGMGAYSHPLTVGCSVAMMREYRLWNNHFFHGAVKTASWLDSLGVLVPCCQWIPLVSEGAYLYDAHTCTFRTPDYILSSVLDWRPGEMGAQVLSWQAGLSADAVVFTTFPAKVSGGSPGYWRGTASNPRIAQYQNVLIALYRQPRFPRLGEIQRYQWTHAWFPEAAFDETCRRGHWIFGRKNHGYIALFSLNPMHPVTEGEFAHTELIAEGPKNAWICEMAQEADWPSFSAFADSLSAATVTGDINKLCYASPSIGSMVFGWKIPFTVAGRDVPLHSPMRYDNPFVHATRDDRRIEITAQGLSYVLDFDKY